MNFLFIMNFKEMARLSSLTEIVIFLPTRNFLIYDNTVVTGLASNEAWSLIMPDYLTVKNAKQATARHDELNISLGNEAFQMSACQKLIRRC